MFGGTITLYHGIANSARAPTALLIIAYSCGMNSTPSPPRWPWPNALSLLLVAALALIWWRPPADLDYCWQIRTGQHMIDSRQLHQPDRFSYTIAGKDIPDVEWLYEVILALVWNQLGQGGLKLARVTLYAAPIALLAWQLRGRNVPRFAIALIVVFSLFALSYFERLRPLVCSTIGLQLVAGWLHDHCHGKRPLDWKLPLTMLLWANLHPAVIMGQGLVFGAIVWHLAALGVRKPVSGECQRAVALLRWGGLSLLATLASPAPIDRLLYPFSPELRHSAQQMFEEIKSPLRHLGHPPFVVELLLLLVVAYGLVLLLRRRELFGWEWALFAGVSGLFLMAIRSAGDFLMISSALAVPQIGPLLLKNAKSVGPLVHFERGIKRIMNSPLFGFQPVWPALGFAAIAVISLLPLGDRLPNRQRADWPTEAADWIEKGGLSGPGPWNVFSGYNEGSYLIWRFDGRVRVYSDTRGFYYPGEFLDDSYALPRAVDNWPAHLEHVLAQGTQYFLLPVRDPAGLRYELWTILELHIAKPLYQDEKYVIVSADQVSNAAKTFLSAGSAPR
jgi:hypothetical protein